MELPFFLLLPPLMKPLLLAPPTTDEDSCFHAPVTCRTIKAASLARQSPAKGGKGGSKSAGLPLMSRGTVDEPDIARVISTWTGIPLTKLVESELDKVGSVVWAVLAMVGQKRPLLQA
jgi:hypothetical protein